MWSKSYSNVYKNVKAEAIWRIWADVNNYLSWHDDLDYCKLEGKFAVGNYFMLKPKGGPAFRIDITELLEDKERGYKRFNRLHQFFWGKDV